MGNCFSSLSRSSRCCNQRDSTTSIGSFQLPPYRSGSPPRQPRVAGRQSPQAKEHVSIVQPSQFSQHASTESPQHIPLEQASKQLSHVAGRQSPQAEEHVFAVQPSQPSQYASGTESPHHIPLEQAPQQSLSSQSPEALETIHGEQLPQPVQHVSTSQLLKPLPNSTGEQELKPSDSEPNVVERCKLEDAHIWDLAKRITNQHDLQELGLKILKVQGYEVDSALYDEKQIQSSACKVLKTWCQSQNNRQEAYINLYSELVKNRWLFLAGELKQWVEGTTEPPSFSNLQNRVKDSLENSLKNCLKHDWLEEDQNFSLMKYYTDFVWERMVTEALGKEEEPIKGMEDILKVPGAGKKCLKILVEAGPGMGKSTSMAMLAMKWVKDKTGEFPFDFVFLIPLRNVDRNCSLAELVIDEHDLEKEEIELVKSILTGKANHKVLLLLDGYDEYTPRTNIELDRAIERRIGKTFIILTSRPKEGTDFTRTIRNKMDGEVVIEGFSEENIKKCCSLYLKKESEAEMFFKEAEKKTGLFGLFKVPIILLMTCVLYNEDDIRSLPER